jgi:hypothetical protein
MKKISLKKLVQDKVVKNISTLRENMNGYPYVTMLVDSPQGTKSQNVYFGQKTSERIMDNYSVGDNIINSLVEAEVIQSVNEAGETRFKLSTGQASEYATEVSLAGAFGIELEAGEFDVELFRKGFTAKPTVSTANAGAGVSA